MLQVETLQKINRRTYEEPDGKLLEFIDSGNNTITVLTRVEQARPPVDPSEHSVSDLKEMFDGDNLNEYEIEALIDAEESDKARKTALGFFEEIKQS